MKAACAIVSTLKGEVSCVACGPELTPLINLGRDIRNTGVASVDGKKVKVSRVIVMASWKNGNIIDSKCRDIDAERAAAKAKAEAEAKAKAEEKRDSAK
jgi:hypothetical protein